VEDHLELVAEAEFDTVQSRNFDADDDNDTIKELPDIQEREIDYLWNDDDDIELDFDPQKLSYAYFQHFKGIYNLLDDDIWLSYLKFNGQLVGPKEYAEHMGNLIRSEEIDKLYAFKAEHEEEIRTGTLQESPKQFPWNFEPKVVPDETSVKADKERKLVETKLMNKKRRKRKTKK
jgi:hypothetical protein